MALTWNPSDKAAAVTLSGGNLTMLSTAASAGVRGTVSRNSGKHVFGWSCAGANFLYLGVANASGLLTGGSAGRNDSNGACYRDGGGASSFRANNNAVNVSGFGLLGGNTGFVAVDITGGKFYIYISGIGWGPGSPDAGTGGYDMSSIAGQALFPYASGDDAFSPYPASQVTIDGAATGHGLSTFTPWDAASTQTLTPSLFTNSQTFYAPTVTRGSVTLTPSLFSNTNAFYSPTVSQGGSTQTLTPSLFTNTNTFYGPTVTPGAVTLTPGLFTNSSSFYAATVTRGAVTLSPGLFTNASTFYSPTVTTGAVTLSPALFTNTSAFYAPTINQAAGNQTLSPSLFTNTSLFYGATILQPSLQTLLPGLFTNASIFFLPTVANDLPGGTYPEAIEGGGSVVRGALQGGGSVVAGSISSNGRVIAGYLRGRP